MRHYALFCESDRSLLAGDGRCFDPDDYLNIGIKGLGRPIGSSQVTALLCRRARPGIAESDGVERHAAKSGSAEPYPVRAAAVLVGPLWASLCDPRPVDASRFAEVRRNASNFTPDRWRDEVSRLRGV